MATLTAPMSPSARAMSMAATSPKNKVNRTPDSAIVQAVESLQKNQKFTRMLIFALKNIADLTHPPNRKFVNNAFYVVQSSALSVLKEVVEGNAKGDSEVMLHVTRILCGISKALLDTPDDDICIALMGDGLEETLSKIVSCGLSAFPGGDKNAVLDAVQCILNYAALGIPVDGEATMAGILTYLDTPKLNPAEVGKIVDAIKVAADSPAACQILLSSQMPRKLLETVSGYKLSEKDAATVAGTVFEIISQCASLCPKGVNDTAVLPLLSSVLDRVQGRRAVSDKGSKTLSALITPEQLKGLLQGMGEQKGRDETLQSLSLLSAMSHMPDFNKQLVAASAIEPLCKALTSAAASFDPKDAAQSKGLAAGCRVLRSVALMPDQAGVLVKRGVLETLSTLASKITPETDDLAAAIVGTMSELALSDPKVAAKVADSKAMLERIFTVAGAAKVEEDSILTTEVAKFLCVLAASDSGALCKKLLACGADMTAMELLRIHAKTPSKTQEILLRFVTSIYASGHAPVGPRCRPQIAALMEVLENSDKEHEQCALLAVKLIEKFGLLAKAEKSSTKFIDEIVASGGAFALLAALAKFSGNSQITSSATAALDVVAVGQDVKEALQRLEKAGAGAKENPMEVVKAFTTVQGLAAVKGLIPKLVEENAAEIVLKVTTSILAGLKFKEQGELTCTGFNCLARIASTSGSGLSEETAMKIISKLLANAQIPQMKNLVAAQSNVETDNVAVCLMRGVACMIKATAGVVTSYPPMIEGISAVMRRYPEARSAQKACLDAFTELVRAGGSDASKKFFHAGTAKQVLAYLQKSYVYEDVQISGVYLLAELLKQDEGNVDALRMAGAVEVLKSTARAHATNAPLQKQLSMLLAMLIPAEAMQAEVEQYLNLLNAAGKNRDLTSGCEALGSLFQLTANSEAAKFASKLGVVESMQKFYDSIGQPPALPEAQMRKAYEVGSLLLNNVATSGKPYTTQMVKSGGLRVISTIMNANNKASDPRQRQVYVECLAAAQKLLQSERMALQLPGAREFQKYLLEQLKIYESDVGMAAPLITCLSLLNDPESFDSPTVMAALRNVIGAMKDPSVADSTRLACVNAVTGILASAKVSPGSTEASQAASRKILAALDEAGLNAALLSLIDMQHDDPNLVAAARHCLNEAAVLGLSTGGGSPGNKGKGLAGEDSQERSTACRAFGRNLGMCMADANAAMINIKLASNFTSRNDKKLIEGSGFLDQLQELVLLHPDNVNLLAAVGELLGNLGMEDVLDGLFGQVITLCNEKPDDYLHDLSSVMAKLNLFIGLQCKDLAAAYGKAPEAMACLSKLLQSPDGEGNVALHEGSVLVARRLAERFGNSPDSPYGAMAIRQTLLPHFISILRSPENPIRGSNLFLRDCYHLLAHCMENPQCLEDILAVLDCDANSLLANTYNLLKAKKEEPEVVAAILKFLAAAAKDQRGVELLEAPKHAENIESRFIGEKLDETVLDFISKLKGKTIVVESGAEFLVNHIRNHKGGVSPMYSEEATNKKLVSIAKSSAAGLSAYMEIMGAIALKDPACVATKGALETAARLWHQLEEGEACAEDKAKCAASLGGLIDACAVAGLTSEIKSVDCPKLLKECIDAHPQHLPTCQKVTKALKSLAANMPETRFRLLSQNCPSLLTTASPLLQGDPIAAQSALEFLKILLQEERNAALFLNDTNGLQETLMGIQTLCADMEDREAATVLVDLLKDVRKLLEDANDRVLTLEDIYTRWLLRKEEGEPIDMSAPDAPLEEVNFVFQYTEDYSRQKVESVESEIARELYFGCACFVLLFESPQNIPKCIDRDCQTFMMNAIRNQENYEVVQWVVQAAVPAVSESIDAARRFAAHEMGAQIVSQCIQRGLEIEKERDEFLFLRLKLAAYLAIDRTYYNGTKCMEKCIEVWDQYDQNAVHVETLKASFKVMRKIVNDHWLTILVEREVPERLLMIVDSKESPYDLLVDTLFLVGAMAVVPEIKTMLGDLKGIEQILELCKRCEKDAKKEFSSKTEQNACLALANLNMGHGKNSNSFGNHKGVEKSIQILNRSFAESMDYDLANASSVLICNTCFKRDDFKEVFGKKGACKAVNEVISQYDGSQNFNSNRCMLSMFKAVANLALLPNNVKRFLDAGLGQSLEAFYYKTDTMSDELITTSLKTLTNLVLENSEAFMVEFAPLIVPLLRFLDKYGGSDAELVSAGLEVLASLCRLPTNIDIFVKNDGISILLRYLNSVKDGKCYEEGLKLLAVLCHDVQASRQMLQFGVIAFILNLLDEFQDLSPDLIVGGLKCLRRVMTTDTSAAIEFPKSGGVAFLCEVLSVAARSAVCDNFAAGTVLEGLRILLQLLAVHPPPHGCDPDKMAEICIDKKLKRAITTRQTLDRTRSFPMKPPGINPKSLSNLNSNISEGSAAASSDDDDLSQMDSLADTDSVTSTSSPVKTTRTGEQLLDDSDSSPVDLSSPAMGGSMSPTGGEVATRLFKPIGPRRYELIGLDAVTAASLASGLAILFTSGTEEQVKCDKIAEFGLTLMAHLVTEKVDGIWFAFSEFPNELEKFTIRVFGRTKEDYCDTKVRILIAGIEIVANLCCMLDVAELAALAGNELVVSTVRDSGAAIHPKKQRNLKRKVEDFYVLLKAHEPGTLRREEFFPLQTYDFPVTHVEFTAEKYPHGVQDLVPRMKHKIRKGSKCKELTIEDGQCIIKPFIWRSSSDLTMLTWMHDKKLENFNYRAALHSIRAVERGKWSTAALREFGDAKKLTPKCCVAMHMNPTESWPNGLELSLIFTSRRNSKKFLERVVEWQAAAAI